MMRRFVRDRYSGWGDLAEPSGYRRGAARPAVGPLTRVESRPVRVDDVVHAMATGLRLAIRSRVGHRPPVVAVKARTEPDPSPAGWR